MAKIGLGIQMPNCMKKPSFECWVERQKIGLGIQMPINNRKPAFERQKEKMKELYFDGLNTSMQSSNVQKLANLKKMVTCLRVQMPEFRI